MVSFYELCNFVFNNIINPVTGPFVNVLTIDMQKIWKGGNIKKEKLGLLAPEPNYSDNHGQVPIKNDDRPE